MDGPPHRTWNADMARERAMEESHRPLWRHFISLVPETDLTGRTVLDFGCNRGGFLRLLHALRPFRRAVGVDIMADSIEEARALAGLVPVEYGVGSDLSAWPARFDIAFSYEVIYLLRDLPAHAAAIRDALKPGAAYYAVTGCHTENPLWPVWRDLIARTSTLPVPDHAPADFAAAFAAAGLEVSVRRFGYDGFVPLAKDRTYYPRFGDVMDYPARDKLVFRAVRPA